MNITLAVTKNCETCARVQSELIQLTKRNRKISLAVTDKLYGKYENLVIFPAIIIGDELFGYGQTDIKRIENYLSNIYKKR
ncbi:MAG: hypothetical protein K9J12_12850 [Melioribacteraceae bacterium]|nr:hypothetical protein [Melioribacteraceae bacterium]MCF8413294.1 hypothetical protein [Melioribacteraceae bacterium]MCF8430853.1 hypothetical protein [Melioribacteraceae bacterium]